MIYKVPDRVKILVGPYRGKYGSVKYAKDQPKRVGVIVFCADVSDCGAPIVRWFRPEDIQPEKPE